MAENVTQTELDEINNTISIQTTVSNETQTYEGKFVGTLVGNATTAKELEKPYNFSLSGDASGTVSVNASSVILPVTVNHSTHADTSDFAGKTQLSARASVADMANTAEFAYRAGKFASILINLTGLITGSGTATNSNTVDIEVTDINANGLFVIGKLPTDKTDTSKVYVDLEGDNFWIYDLENKQWVNAYSTLLKELEKHNVRITALEKGLSEHSNHLDTIDSEIDALQTLTTTHTADINTLQNRATALEETSGEHTTQISSLENRVGNIETSTDVGQFATRLQAIEDKNTEQDTAISDEVKARTDADSVLETKIETKIETKNTEQDERLDAIETKNTEQDTALTNAKTELSKAIADNKTATDKSISNLTTSLANDYVTLGTAQTITGQKTIARASEPLVFQDPRIEVGVTPSSQENMSILFTDKNKKITSYLQSSFMANNEHTAHIVARNYKEDGTQVNGVLGVGVDSTGNTRTYVPTPKITSNDTNIANTAWVRQLTENTEQNINAIKRINTYQLQITNPDLYTNWTIPSTDKNISIMFAAKHPNNTYTGVGYIETGYGANGYAYNRMVLQKKKPDSEEWYSACTFLIGIRPDNTTYAECVADGMYAPSYQSTSDRRLKSDFEEVHTDLSSLTTYRYTFQPDGKKHIGLIAQDVQKIIPEAVSENPEHYLTLDYNAITACLVAEVNALKKRVAELEEKIK